MPDLDAIKDLIFPTLTFLAGTIVLVAAIIRRIELRGIQINLTNPQSVMLGVLGLLFLVVSLVIYSRTISPSLSITGAPAISSSVSPPLTTEYQIPSNLAKHFDFEQQIDKSITLAVCNNSADQSPWFENCSNAASSRLLWQDGGFTGLHSLGFEAEALTDKEQVYAVRWRLEPPVIARIISAEVYVPDGSFIYHIDIAAWTQGGQQWKVTALDTDRSGWQQVLLDLQQFIDENGNLASDNAITLLNLDIFIGKAPQQAKESLVLIDDIFFFYPASKPYPTLAPLP